MLKAMGIVSLDNLRVGLRWGDERGWWKDFANAYYDAIYRERENGVTEQWWSATVDRLSKWRALRPSFTKAVITARGAGRLSAITGQYRELKAKSALVAESSTEPSIVDLCWEDVAPLFALASEIKPVKSPVFPSKMCHFLFPKLFIPMDNLATGILDYEFWWRGMKDEWCRFRDRDEAVRILTKAIGESLRPSYPLETKIMEISQIGYNYSP
jgi:hypothetical protein